MFSNDPAVARIELLTIIQALHKEEEKPELELRKKQVESILEHYWNATGENPIPYARHRLADYLLIDHLTDTNKRHRKNYFQSKKQEKKKQLKELPSERNLDI
jgi:hypothetical protein